MTVRLHTFGYLDSVPFKAHQTVCFELPEILSRLGMAKIFLPDNCGTFAKEGAETFRPDRVRQGKSAIYLVPNWQQDLTVGIVDHGVGRRRMRCNILVAEA